MADQPPRIVRQCWEYSIHDRYECVAESYGKGFSSYRIAKTHALGAINEDSAIGDQRPWRYTVEFFCNGKFVQQLKVEDNKDGKLKETVKFQRADHVFN